MRMFGLLGVVLAAAACGGAPEDEESTDDTAAALDANVHVETQLAEPRKNGVDHHILGRIAQMIRQAPPRSSIRIALFSIDDQEVFDALVALVDPKQHRDVALRVVQNGEARDKPMAKALAKALGDAHRFCGGGQRGACISKADSSIMHSKLFLFSRTRDENDQPRSHVTWFGSANMTRQTGAATWNNAVAVYGDAKLYDALGEGYFERLWRQDDGDTKNDDFYDADRGRGYFVSAASGTVVHASPSATDLVAARLANVTPGDGCAVMVSQNMIHDSRPQVIAQLVRLASDPRGCKVRVLVNHHDGSVGALQRAGATVRFSPTHDKLFLVDARWDGSKSRRQLVFTGSHNWTASANTTNDELLVRLQNPAVYGPFVKYFERQWDASDRL
jgi:PLD-like domain